MVETPRIAYLMALRGVSPFVCPGVSPF